MRDIKRIERILNKIYDLWQENPDLRLCQLIYKILGESKYLSDNDWFYVEDDYLESLINVEHSQGDWIQYEDVGKLQAENARLKELNREMVEALNVWANGTCKDTECEKTINMLRNRGILSKAEWREEEAEKMEANKRLANQQYLNYVREGE